MAWRRRGPGAAERFPGFRDVVEIGRGRRATVHRAVDRDSGQPVALKVFDVGEVSARAVEAAQRRLAPLRTLTAHPHLVTLYDVARTADGRPMTVLELCAGPLAMTLPARQALATAVKLAAALDAAHRAGVHHGRVGPGAVLVTAAGEPALSDVGAGEFEFLPPMLRSPVDPVSPHAAPELFEGAPVSAAADVYALASTLYELLTGRPAFAAYDGESAAGLVLRILRDPVRPLPADVPVRLSDLVVGAMAKRADERPTAAEFAAALREVDAADEWPTGSDLPAEADDRAPDERSRLSPGTDRIVGGWTPPPLPAELPAASPGSAAAGDAVPIWAVRPGAVPPAAARSGPASDEPAAVPAPEGPPQGQALRDPPPRTTVRSGLCRLTADDDGLRLRRGHRSRRLAWDDVLAIDRSDGDPAVGGAVLVALTRQGPVELPVGSLPRARLAELQALLTAHLARAQGRGERRPQAGPG